MFLSTVFTLFCLMASVPSRCVSESNDQLFSGRTPLHRARENYRKAPWGDPSSICLPAGESLLILNYFYLTFTYFYSYLLVRYLFYSYPFYPFLFMSHWLTHSFLLNYFYPWRTHFKSNLTHFYSVLGVVYFKPCKENQNEIKRWEKK